MITIDVKAINPGELSVFDAKTGERVLAFPLEGRLAEIKECDSTRIQLELFEEADESAQAPYLGKYKSLSDLGRKLHPGEPVFIIRGQDINAAQTILDYAKRVVRIQNTRIGTTLPNVDTNFVADIISFAQRVTQWQLENSDAVKNPD